MRKLLIPLLFVCSRLTISAQTQILVLHHVNPETIFQPDVIKMDAAMLSYLQAVDGMTLVFSSSMPSSLRPKEGDILLSVDTRNRLLSDGFAGRVTSVGETVGTLQVACARVEDVSDIFVQLFTGPNGNKIFLRSRTTQGNFWTGT